MTLVRYLGAATALLALAACGRMVAAQAPDDGAELAKKLAQRVTIDKEMKDISFAEAVDYFRAKFELPILIDPLWQQQKVGGQPPLMKRTEEVPGALADRLAVSLRQVAVGDIASPVTIPAIKNVKLETLLRHVLDQVGATFLVMPDHLKITGHDFAVYESGQRGTEGSGDPLVEPELPRETMYRVQPLTKRALVQVNAKERPLAEVLKELAERTGANVVLAPQAQERSVTPVTARLANAPLDAAVRVLADMTGLAVVEQANVLYVTTPERAAELARAELERLRRRMMLDPNAGLGVCAGVAGFQGGIGQGFGGGMLGVQGGGLGALGATGFGGLGMAGGGPGDEQWKQIDERLKKVEALLRELAEKKQPDPEAK